MPLRGTDSETGPVMVNGHKQSWFGSYFSLGAADTQQHLEAFFWQPARALEELPVLFMWKQLFAACGKKVENSRKTICWKNPLFKKLKLIYCTYRNLTNICLTNHISSQSVQHLSPCVLKPLIQIGKKPQEEDHRRGLCSTTGRCEPENLKVRTIRTQDGFASTSESSHFIAI